MNAPFETIRELSLPSSSGMDLRFYDQVVRAEFAGRLFSLLRSGRRFTPRRGDAKLLQQLPGLVLVNVHLTGRGSLSL